MYTHLNFLRIFAVAFLPIALVIGYMQLAKEQDRSGPVPPTTEPEMEE